MRDRVSAGRCVDVGVPEAPGGLFPAGKRFAFVAGEFPDAPEERHRSIAASIGVIGELIHKQMYAEIASHRAPLPLVVLFTSYVTDE